MSVRVIVRHNLCQIFQNTNFDLAYLSTHPLESRDPIVAITYIEGKGANQVGQGEDMTRVRNEIVNATIVMLKKREIPITSGALSEDQGNILVDEGEKLEPTKEKVLGILLVKIWRWKA